MGTCPLGHEKGSLAFSDTGHSLMCPVSMLGRLSFDSAGMLVFVLGDPVVNNIALQPPHPCLPPSFFLPGGQRLLKPTRPSLPGMGATFFFGETGDE